MKTVALDTEDNSKGELISIGIFSADGFEYFTDREDAILRLCALSPADVWMVNAEYDLVNLFRERWGLIEMRYNESRFISSWLRGRRVRFFDLLNHVQAGVAELGEMIHLPKLEFDPHSRAYLERDCEIVYRFVSDYLLKFYEGLGVEPSATLPSVSMRYWMKKHKPEDLQMTALKGKEREFVKAGYFGGRVELWRAGWVETGPIYSEDVHSMYPAMMRETLPDFRTARFSSRWSQLSDMVEATVEIPPLWIAPLPYREQVTGRILYPTGQVRGVWSGVELAGAKRYGVTVTRIHQVLTFAEGFPWLRGFVEKLYEMRRAETNPVMKFFLKIFLNSLYGKFGQEGKATRLVDLRKVKNYAGPIHSQFGFVSYQTRPPKFSNLIWSAVITARARVKLLEMMNRAGMGLLYSDTDSVIYRAQEPLYNEGAALGEVGLEGEFDRAYFLAPKLYGLFKGDVSKVRAKGVPRKLAEDFLMYREVIYPEPLRLRESRGRFNEANVWRDVVKKFRSEYDRKRLDRDSLYWPPNLTT